MKLKCLLYIVLLSSSMSVWSQREANNWFFGDNAGLTWNTVRSATGVPVGGTTGGARILDGLPTVIPSSINTTEGCFSLSTNQGAVLMYSDGERIWDRTNIIMPNGSGMQGSFSAAQSGIILPYPGQYNKYLAVSIGVLFGPNPYYSVVDMALPGNGTLANPLGDVVPGQKNIEFTGTLGRPGESVTSVLHANGVDYWLIAPGRGPTSYLNAWLITTAGPENTNPVTTPMSLTTPTPAVSGYIKFTSDGRHFAWTNATSLAVYGDFDTATGQFSNLKYIDSLDGPYGVEFSPSMKYLYIGGYKKLYVYDLDVLLNWPSMNATSAPRKVFDIGVEHNGLQLASDGRIYMTAAKTHYLYIITNPNEYNDLKIYELPNNFLGAGFSRIGLPAFSASWFRYEPEIAAFSCAGYPAKISIEIDGVVEPTATLDWNFGDGHTFIGQPVTNGITEYSQMHTYANAGVYTVTVTPRRTNGTALETVTVVANVVECAIKTNRMIRTNLLNSDTKNLY